MDTGHYNCRDYHVTHREDDSLTELLAALTTQRQPLHSRSPLDSSLAVSNREASFPFFSLPLELRQKVYIELLPRTFRSSHEYHMSRHFKYDAKLIPIWRRGQTSLLCVCKQMHAECAPMLYGMNTFAVLVNYDSIKFRMRSELPSGLTPSRSYDFLDVVPPRYLGLLRQWVIIVIHVDDYEGMIKHNVTGKGLTYGLRNQVRKLVMAFNASVESVEDATPSFNRIIVSLIVGDVVDCESIDIIETSGLFNQGVEELQTVLSPLADLHGTAAAEVEGAVTEDFAVSLQEAMMRV